MRLTWIPTIGTVAAVTLLLASSLSASPPVSSVDHSDTPGVNQYLSERSSKLLKDLRVIAGKLDRQAENLDVFARSPQYSWLSHASYLNSVRDYINEAGRMLSELQSIRHGVAPWQRQAIDAVHPVAARLASLIQAAIEYLNENQSLYFAPEYNSRLTEIAEHANQMKETVHSYLKYAETQSKLDRLKTALGLAGS